MHRLKGFLILFLCLLGGYLLHRFLPLPIPEVIYGMMLLLLLLLLHIVKLDDVAPAGDSLTAVLVFLFIPGGVGIMQYFHLFEGVVIQVLLLTIVTTLLTAIVTATVVHLVIASEERRASRDK